MTSKYYKRETVVYKFKHEMLMDEKYSDATEEQKRILWNIFLLALCQTKKLSKHQAETWVYPEEELTYN